MTEISGQFQDNFAISGISGLLGPLQCGTKLARSFNDMVEKCWGNSP